MLQNIALQRHCVQIYSCFDVILYICIHPLLGLHEGVCGVDAIRLDVSLLSTSSEDAVDDTADSVK